MSRVISESSAVAIWKRAIDRPTLVLVAETESRRGCFPGPAASCKGGQCPGPCHRPGACRVRARPGNLHRAFVARLRLDAQVVRAARWDRFAPCKPGRFL